ncbi:MAG: NHL repeat-containing protein [bacterium]
MILTFAIVATIVVGPSAMPLAGAHSVARPIAHPIAHPAPFPMHAGSPSLVAGCPQGAEYLATAADLPGVVGVAAIPSARKAAGDASGVDSGGFVLCAFEAIEPAARLKRVRLGEDGIAEVLPGIEAPRGEGCSAPCAIDVREDGLIAVADAGGFVRLFGGEAPRTLGVGLLGEPSGVAFHPKGVVVSDRRVGAVFLLDEAGSELTRIGTGQLGDPRGLALLEDGSVLVADRLRDCVWRFAPSANGLPTSTGVPIGEFGSNPGQFNAPGDVAILGTGDEVCILVADELNHRVQILDAVGRFAGFFGMHALVPRMGEGHIHYPRSIAISSDGSTLVVAEAFEDRAQFFRLTPEPPPPGIPPSTELISSHFGPEIACAGDLLAIVDIESEAVGILDARTTPPIHMTLMGGGGANPQRFREVSALAIEPERRRVWIADRGRAAIDVYDIVWDPSKEPIVDLFMPRLARSMRLDAFAERLRASSTASAARPLSTPDPTDIAFLTPDAGRVLILDRANLAVIATDPRLSAGEFVSLPKEARVPEELAIASDGRWAVTDPVAQSIFVRAVDGTWSTLRTLGGIPFVRPSGVAFLADGGFAVSDAARDAVVVGVPDGVARLVGGKGVLDEQFWDPQAIATSPKGHLVIDRGNHRFQRFGDGFTWNLTGSMGRYYDRKRKGSPGGPPLLAPANSSGASNATGASGAPAANGGDS